VLQQNPDIEFKREHAQEIVSVNDLIDNHFLVVSENYLDWVKSIALDNSTPSLVKQSLS
jgi:hypothetical protein